MRSFVDSAPCPIVILGAKPVTVSGTGPVTGASRSMSAYSSGSFPLFCDLVMGEAAGAPASRVSVSMSACSAGLSSCTSAVAACCGIGLGLVSRAIMSGSGLSTSSQTLSPFTTPPAW